MVYVVAWADCIPRTDSFQQNMSITNYTFSRNDVGQPDLFIMPYKVIYNQYITLYGIMAYTVYDITLSVFPPSFSE